MRTRSSLEYTIPRRRNRRRSRQQQEAIPIVDKFPIQMADDRPMAEQLQAPTGGHQLDTFYNSLSYNDQDSLNSAAGGNFLYKSPTEGLQIIENKAKVRCSRNAVMRVSMNAPPSSSTSSSSNFEFQQMAAALEDKMTLTF
ncbi:hypothetical protein Tco_0860744 [Tanacetum coccineum]|uniref:Uncharacterized protein n=1 Tax=Tanacetum coccineum TaxID=301880 RepID=A0ABQ5BIR9_9ASTR